MSIERVESNKLDIHELDNWTLEELKKLTPNDFKRFNRSKLEFWNYACNLMEDILKPYVPTGELRLNILVSYAEGYVISIFHEWECVNEYLKDEMDRYIVEHCSYFLWISFKKWLTEVVDYVDWVSKSLDDKTGECVDQLHWLYNRLKGLLRE